MNVIQLNTYKTTNKQHIEQKDVQRIVVMVWQCTSYSINCNEKGLQFFANATRDGVWVSVGNCSYYAVE